MKVTPWRKLSEELLSQGIKSFYRQKNLVPVGVTEEALAPWAAKMAMASRKLVQRFRRIYCETPENAKSNSLKELKRRLQRAEIIPPPRAKRGQTDEADMEPVEPQKAAIPDTMEQLVSPPPKHLDFDWAKLSGLAQKRLVSNAAAKEKDNAVVSEKPVATPARSSRPLPGFVLLPLRQEMRT